METPPEKSRILSDLNHNELCFMPFEACSNGDISKLEELKHEAEGRETQTQEQIRKAEQDYVVARSATGLIDMYLQLIKERPKNKKSLDTIGGERS